MIRTYWETVFKRQFKKSSNNTPTIIITVVVKENCNILSPPLPTKKKWGKVGGKMAICICIRKKEKLFISISTQNCEQVKYCPTTYNGIWQQGRNSGADKLLKAAHFEELDYTHRYTCTSIRTLGLTCPELCDSRLRAFSNTHPIKILSPNT